MWKGIKYLASFVNASKNLIFTFTNEEQVSDNLVWRINRIFHSQWRQRAMQELVWNSYDLSWCQCHTKVSGIQTSPYHFPANLKGNWNDHLKLRCLYHVCKHILSPSTGVYKSDLSLFRSLNQFQKLPNTDT